MVDPESQNGQPPDTAARQHEEADSRLIRVLGFAWKIVKFISGQVLILGFGLGAVLAYHFPRETSRLA
jgi:succinyl-CoA synthetase beta subunit